MLWEGGGGDVSLRTGFKETRVERDWHLVQDDLELLDDVGEIPKSQGRGWLFDSRLRNLLST